jgi:hypothetical protein
MIANHQISPIAAGFFWGWVSHLAENNRYDEYNVMFPTNDGKLSLIIPKVKD